MDGKVTVIIPCRNEYSFIQRCLNSLINNDYPNKEVIVVDGMSNDGTRDIIAEYQEKHDIIKLLNNPKEITPVALNIGLDAAEGDYIMIAGAHSWFPENYISRMVKELNQLPDACGVGGAIVTRAGNTKVSHSIVKVMSDIFGVGNSMFRLGTRNPIRVDTIPYGLYKKETFEKVGKYDERLVRNQDIEFAKRIWKQGGKLYLVPDVVCYYQFKGNFRYLARSNFKNGYWNILTLYITGRVSSLSIRHFIPLTFIMALLVPLLLSLFIQCQCLYLSLVIFLLYLAVMLIKSIQLNNKQTQLFSIFWSFMVLHFSYGFGSFLALFKLNRLIHS